ncbi:ciliogenesis and planar polarity effector 1 [Polymixia lowei]
MELKLEVVLSSSIKRKKPWPQFCWLGQEKESVFLLDNKRISEINMVSGRTKKKTPKLYPLLNSVVTMAASQTGAWLAGLLVSGELFLWNKDKDSLKTAAAVPEVAQLITAVQGNASHLSLHVSGDGMRVLLVALTGQVFLWECTDVKELTGVRDGTARGKWAHIQHLEDAVLPTTQEKEASQHSIFVKTEAMGDVCLSAFVFTSGEKLTVTFLKIQWDEGHANRVGSVRYSVRWATKTYPMSRLTPTCHPVKSRGSLVPAFSPEGQLLAIVVNQRDPRATQVLFVSTQNFVSISRGLGGCGSKKLDIPSKYVRSYWVGSVNWSPGGLFLACVLKRGSLLMLARLGGLLSLSSSGCNVDFGPAHFLPLHPLVTYRPPVSARKAEASLSSSSMSVLDVLRQRYSVTWHPRLFYLIVSDGYMATVLRVPQRPSPAQLIKALLQDTRKDLEKTSRILDKSQIHVRAWLESVSCLNLSSSQEELRPIVTSGPNTPESAASPAKAGSSLPLFLQDQGTMDDTRELLHRVQAFFEDDSDLDGQPAGSHVEEGGRLEFASMFDTLHALSDTQIRPSTLPDPEPEQYSDSVDSERKTSTLLRELGHIQRGLLTAWALGVSLGGALEHREHLLKCTLRCVVRFAALLRLVPNSTAHARRKNTSASSSLLRLLGALLDFLPWDATRSGGPGCLGLVVELSQRLVRLLLSPSPDSYQIGHSDCQLSSQSLATVLLILQQASDCLDHAYSLQQRTVWAPTLPDSNSLPPQLRSADVFCVPLLQEEKEGKPGLVRQALPVPQRPSSRLLGVWQWVYRITRQYLEELKGFRGRGGWDEEQEQVSLILCQIQTALQSTGERLEAGTGLLSYPGEHHFLSGSYTQSADAWRSQMWAERTGNRDRRVFQETRSCLALLYGLLCQYRLREAQGLGDHMARLILHRAGQQKEDMSYSTAEAPLGSWLPAEIHSEAAFAVVHTLGRFMASYFTNQPLYILPPHNVDVLPPVHLPQAPGVGRLVPLCQEGVAGAVRAQQLSDVWTVDYTQDLLLIGGLLPEAVWLAHRLGDWKTAASLGLAYTSYRTEHCDFTRLRWRELHLPTALEPGSIFQAQLEFLLGRKSGSQETEGDKDGYKSFADSLQGEDWESLQVSVQEIMKASVMAGVDVTSAPLSALLDSAKDLSSCLPALVPVALYLPAPPLYCPQPAPNTQDPVGTLGQLQEVASRHKVSAVLQRLLLLLRSARCCHPAAQWYISHLRRARHLLHKIKQKYSHSRAAEEERPLPDGLMKFITRGGFFKQGPNRDGHLDPVTIQTIICFRELCGLCWMLHVRDQLSVSCRRYQAARHRDREGAGGSEVRSSCVDALHWARRFLPFSRFLNAEEILQDVLLSLVSELPPVSMVAETLVRAFPEEEESVRVPLREKYNSLLQRLKHCAVLEEDREETSEIMMVHIQDKLRQRRKDLLRLQRHLAPPELFLWEREEEEEDRGGRRSMARLERLSLGASLSNSTLTDWGHPLVYSDGDTAENTSEALSPQVPRRPTSSSKRVKVQDGEDSKRIAVKKDKVIQEEKDSGPGPDKEPEGQRDMERPSLPVVGTWEFELEDEEYLSFLELFLSYVLERDSPDGGDSEPPLLKGFCSQLRERELHSLTFDVLTTLRRRQRDGRHLTRRHEGGDAPVFRAGHCYKSTPEGATPEPQTSSVWSEAPVSRTNLSVISLPWVRTGKQQGLFGLRRQARLPPEPGTKGGRPGSEPSPVQSAVPWEQPSKCLGFGSLASTEPPMEPQQGLDPKLEAQFPKLGRLLEWMVRWADRRAPLGSHSKNNQKERGTVDGGMDAGGVVIRVKASTPAVLTALGLLERRYSAAQLGTDRYSTRIQVPETQWTVAPVLQPEVGWKLERESSVDTGYPGSANTPIPLLDQDAQQGEPSFGSHTEEPERATSKKTPDHNDQEQVTFDCSLIRTSTSQHPSPHKLDVTPEKEDNSFASEGLRASSSLSTENISGHIQSPELALKLEDLHSSGRDGELSTSHGSSMPADPEAPPQLEPEDPSILRTEAGAHAELSAPSGLQRRDTPVVPPCLQPQSSTTSAAGQTAPDQTPPAQTEPVRQLLNDELFRLVQLQQINFMSLMHMVGTSFANLPVIQQNALAQSNVSLSHQNVPSSHTTSFPTQPNVLPFHSNTAAQPQTKAGVSVSESNNPQFNHVPRHRPTDKPVLESSAKISSGRPVDQPHTTKDLHSTINSAEVNSQEMQPLSVQAELPQSLFGEGRRLIPSSQGLLTTIDRSKRVPSAPLVTPSDENTQNIPASQVPGLKLLQLQPGNYPPVREAWGPQTANTGAAGPPPFNLRMYDREEQEKIKASSGLTRHPSLGLDTNPPHDPTPRSTQSQKLDPRLERSRGAEFPSLPAHRPPPTPGVRLLHFHPVPHSSTTFPQLSIPPSSTPSVIPAPIGDTSRIQLLHIDPEPRMMLPLAAPPARAAPLVPLEELTGLAFGRQNEARLQLLRVDPLAQSTGKTTPSSCSYSNKRQKRREDKMKMGERAEVTFRPNVSIIPAEEPVSEEPAAVRGDSTLGQGFAIPLGSFDSLLTGQRLLDKAMSTAAELHAFASTQKRPPQSHDACTNTDPACPPTLVDKAISAQASVIAMSPESQSSAAVLPPDLFLNLRFPREPPVQDTEETPQEPEKNVDLEGRHFINVIDLEDGALLRELPSCSSPTLLGLPAAQRSPPTSAQLHLIAASVVNSAAAAPHASVTIAEENLTPVTQPDPPEDRSPPTQVQPTGDPVTVSLLQDRADPSKAYGAREPQSPRPCRTFSIPPAVQFSTRLSEMDVQLAALQNIADHMEMELANSRTLVNTIEMLSPVLAPDVENRMPLNKTVSLSVPQKALRPRPCFTEPNDFKEEGEGHDESHVVHIDSSVPERQPTFLFPQSAASQRTGPARHHTPSKMKDHLVEAPGTSGICPDETLGLTGLSDIADILGQLVRDGALSPNDLALSHSQAPHLNRLEQQQRGSVLQRDVSSDGEHRRELRTWMRRKQRERLADYQKQREVMREREYRPYSTSVPSKSTYKNKAAIREKEEKNKVMLLEQYNQRSREACNLISDCATTPLTLPSSLRTEAAPSPSSMQPTTAQTSGNVNSSYRTRALSADIKRGSKTQSGQARHNFSPREHTETLRWPISLENHHRRLGLHRPVSYLPRDRLSQVTRRGMLSDTRNKAKLHTSNQRDELHREHRRKMALSKSPPGRSAVEREVRSDRREMGEQEEREVVNSWNPPPEICRLLGMEELELDVAGLLEDQEDGARAAASGTDWLENLSETASSGLSKLDWAAIESMIAGEGTI